MKPSSNNEVVIGPYRFSERELAQINRRKMITKSVKNKKKFDKCLHRKHYYIYEQ